jgi:integrase
MAQRIRKYKLESRTPRLEMKSAKKPLFVRLGRGLSLGYRRNKRGTWVARQANGKGGSATCAIGVADDFDDADGQNILDFWQAQEKVKARFRTGGTGSPLTVRQAFDLYIVTLEARNRRSAEEVRGRLEKHFFPEFERRRIIDLTRSELDKWLASMVKKSDDQEIVRRSRDSANRVLSMVKAVLNHAFKDVTNGIDSDVAWRRVEPFRDVGQPRNIRYSPGDAQSLIAACRDPKLAELVQGSYLTGARYGELNSARIRHFDLRGKSVQVSGKTGSRDVMLQAEAVDFLKRITAGRQPEDFIFVKADGTKWKASDQTRPIKAAIKAAGLDEQGCLYLLRHAYISESIEKNVPLTIIAKNCGTSVRMIEKTYAKILKEKERQFIEAGAPSLRSRE